MILNRILGMADWIRGEQAKTMVERMVERSLFEGDEEEGGGPGKSTANFSDTAGLGGKMSMSSRRLNAQTRKDIPPVNVRMSQCTDISLQYTICTISQSA